MVRTYHCAPARSPLTHEIVLAAHQLLLPNPAPADRFLAATAQVLGLTLVTGCSRSQMPSGHYGHRRQKSSCLKAANSVFSLLAGNAATEPGSHETASPPPLHNRELTGVATTQATNLRCSVLCAQASTRLFFWPPSRWTLGCERTVPPP